MVTAAYNLLETRKISVGRRYNSILAYMQGWNICLCIQNIANTNYIMFV